MKTKREFFLGVLLVLGIAIGVNILAQEYFFRLDLTEDKQYTLDQATRDIMSSVNEPVTVKAYFSEDLPPAIGRTRTEFQEMLVEFASLSDDRLVYEFINPNESDELEAEAAQSGISPILIDVRERDEMRQLRAFLGAVIEMGEQREVIPFVQPGGPGMEYSLASAIKKMSVTDKPIVGFIQGHGEPGLGAIQQALQSLDILYQVETLDLTSESTIPIRFSTIAMIAPTDTIPPEDFEKLDGFLARGGDLLVAVNRVNGDLNQARGFLLETGLEGWLAAKGIEVQPEFIVDAQAATVSVQQQQGAFRFRNQVAFPYLPIISSFPDHPVGSGLESVMMQFASPIQFTGDTTLSFTPVAKTSNRSGSQNAPVFFDINRRWTATDFPDDGLVVGAVLEGPISGDAESRLLVFGDGDFAVGGEGQQARQVQPDNVNLLVNGIDWLSDDTGLISLRNKGVSSRPIEELEDGTKTMLKYMNFLLPLLLVIGYGFYRSQRTRSRRAQRLEERYT